MSKNDGITGWYEPRKKFISCICITQHLYAVSMKHLNHIILQEDLIRQGNFLVQNTEFLYQTEIT